MSNKHNRIGERYGELEITGRAERTHKNGGGIIWLTTCHACGKTNYPISTTKMTRYGRVDCGCKRYVNRSYPVVKEDCSVCGTVFDRRSNSTTTVCSKTCKDTRTAKLSKLRLQSSLSAKIRSAANTARHKAKLKGMKCDITADFVEGLMNRHDCKCHITLIPFETTGPFVPSIDRIDSSRGYTKDNIQVVCWIYNRCKADNTHEDVIKFAKGLLGE